MLVHAIIVASVSRTFRIPSLRRAGGRLLTHEQCTFYASVRCVAQPFLITTISMTANMLLYKSFILCWLSSVSVAFVNGPRRVTPRATTSWSSTTLLGMGLTLYGSQGSRSPLVNWALYELGLEFEMGDLRKNPHPFGQIPCLTDNDDVSVFESGAILLYINSLSEEKLSPAEKAQVMSWVMWANASLDPICFLETPDGKVYVLRLLILKVMSPL